MKRKYIVRLDAQERCRLEQLVGVGKAAAYRIRHANILLAVDESDAGPKMKDVDAARKILHNEPWGSPAYRKTLDDLHRLQDKKAADRLRRQAAPVRGRAHAMAEPA